MSDLDERAADVIFEVAVRSTAVQGATSALTFLYLSSDRCAGENKGAMRLLALYVGALAQELGCEGVPPIALPTDSERLKAQLELREIVAKHYPSLAE